MALIILDCVTIVLFRSFQMVAKSELLIVRVHLSSWLIFDPRNLICYLQSMHLIRHYPEIGLHCEPDATLCENILVDVCMLLNRLAELAVLCTVYPAIQYNVSTVLNVSTCRLGKYAT